MEKHPGQEMPPPYVQSHGYNNPQNPPSYYQAHPDQVPLQPGHQPVMYHGGPPQQYVHHQPYPNVIVQQPMGVPVAGPPPPDHMTHAIFVTLCCFWPTGIIAIMKANEAKNAYIRGDVVGANNSARSSKNMINISVIAGICSIIVSAVIIGLYWGLVMSKMNEFDDGY